MTDIETTWQRVEAWLAQNAPQVVQGLAPGATDEQITIAERTLGGRLSR